MGLTPDLPAESAAVLLSRRLLAAIEANEPGVLADRDPEFLHDLRVAVRRTRSLLRELKTVFPPGQLAHFRAEFKWVQQITGPVRDLDVFLLTFDQPELDALRSVLGEHRATEREALEAALRSERMEILLREWNAFLGRLPTLPVDDRPDAVRPIGDLAALRIEHVYRQMVRMGKAIDKKSPHQDLHDLRKKGKELRYLLEFFAPLFPGKVTKPMVKTLKALQDTLGRFQDREVQAAMIRGLAPDFENLALQLEEEQREARTEFKSRFGPFSSKDQRRLVKATFG